MPKERFHLLVADQILPELPMPVEAAENSRMAYLLGAITPDALFYDVPSFRFSPVATALHRLEGHVGMETFSTLIIECKRELTPPTRMGLLGMALHLLTDRFWHPIIEKMASFARQRSLPGEFKMSSREAHQWVESNLEGFWLDRRGPKDGYRPLLKGFAEPGKTREACAHGFQMILRRLGGIEVPSVRRIERCISWQAFLLGQCSLPVWAKRQTLLLRFRATRFWGTLIVPPKPDGKLFLPLEADAHGGSRNSIEDPFSEQPMARSLSFLTKQLRSLAAQL